MKRAIAFLAVVMLLGACGGDSTGPSDPAGTYTMRTVNGDPLPWRDPASTSVASFTVLSGHITLNRDGTYSEATSWRATEYDATWSDTDRFTGTWTRQGTNITLNVTGGLDYSVAWNGNTLTQVMDGYTIVYRR